MSFTVFEPNGNLNIIINQDKKKKREVAHSFICTWADYLIFPFKAVGLYYIHAYSLHPIKKCVLSFWVTKMWEVYVFLKLTTLPFFK